MVGFLLNLVKGGYIKAEQLITEPFKRSGQFLARSVQQLGGTAIPGLRTAKGQPAVIGEFEGRVGVATGLLEAEDTETLEDRAAMTVHLMAQEGMIDEETEFVEIHPLAPRETFQNSAAIQAQHRVAGMALAGALQEAEYAVTALPYYATPIAPTMYEDSPVDPGSLLEAVGSELIDLKTYNDQPRRRLAMLAIGERPYARRVLREQPGFEEDDLDKSPLMVMQRKDEATSEDLVLMPAQPPRLLEAGEPAPTRLV